MCRGPRQFQRLAVLLAAIGLAMSSRALALPPPEDIPEEVLRQQVILEGRSPVTGEPLTATERAALEAALANPSDRVQELPPQVQEVIRLLRLRQGLRILFPFIP